MNQLFLLFVSILCIACSGQASSLTQVTSEITIGNYIVSPPTNYWYYSREYPSSFQDVDDIFLLTFNKDKQSLTAKHPGKNGTFFNISISNSKYSSTENYYTEAKKWGVEHANLPEREGKTLNLNSWSCMQVTSGMSGIECISLRNHLITIGVFGSDGEAVLANVELLQKVLLSFQER